MISIRLNRTCKFKKGFNLTCLNVGYKYREITRRRLFISVDE